jgi:hypothetical protein
MKNPRGYYLNGFLMIALLLFALGSIQGNPVAVKYHIQTELTNSPPGQIVSAIIETSNFQIAQEQPADILLSRGVSVPYRGLINQATIINYQSNSGDMFVYIGNRYLSLTNIKPNRFGVSNQLRGANTRLDIGEGASDPAGIRKT